MDQDPKTLAARHSPRAAAVIQPSVQLCVLRYSPCGSTLAAGGFDGLVHRWDAGREAVTGRPPLEGHGGWVQTLAFLPAGDRLVSADSWGRLCCWPYRDEVPAPDWVVDRAHDGWVRQVAVDPIGSRLATCGSDRAVRLWSAGGRKLREWADHGEDVFAVAFRPDGSTLVSGDLKGTVRERDPATGATVREYDARVLYRYDRIQDVGGVRCLAFDPSGKLLACSGTSPRTGGFVRGVPTILIFDGATAALRLTLTVGGDNDGFVHDLTWHPDGFVMAVTSGQPGNGRLVFWRPGDPEPFLTLTEMPNCHALSIHPGAVAWPSAPPTRAAAVTGVASSRASTGGTRRRSTSGICPGPMGRDHDGTVVMDPDHRRPSPRSRQEGRRERREEVCSRPHRPACEPDRRRGRPPVGAPAGPDPTRRAEVEIAAATIGVSYEVKGPTDGSLGDRPESGHRVISPIRGFRPDRISSPTGQPTFLDAARSPGRSLSSLRHSTPGSTEIISR